MNFIVIYKLHGQEHHISFENRKEASDTFDTLIKCESIESLQLYECTLLFESEELEVKK